MRSPQGRFIWYELQCPDKDRAIRFYSDLFGWTASDMEGSQPPYTVFSAGATPVGGLLTAFAAEMGNAAFWTGYIAVDDVDASAAAIVADGGVQHVAPRDIPGVGRFAMMADRQGAMFYIMRGASEDRSEAFAMGRPGHCSWNELSTTDPADAIAFYQRHFGWAKGDTMPMGAMGDYQIMEHDGEMFAAVMQTPDTSFKAFTFYFAVSDIDAAVGRVRAGGGNVLYGPMEIPGGEYSATIADSQGAVLGLVGPRKG